MTARSQMTMRAFVQENANAGEVDAHNNPAEAIWSPKETIACFAWSRTKVEAVSEDRTAIIEDLRCTMPIDADVSPSDRIQKIVNRTEAAAIGTGRVYFPGPLAIETIQLKPTHQELNLRAIS